jgi:hypothetical protein
MSKASDEYEERITKYLDEEILDRDLVSYKNVRIFYEPRLCHQRNELNFSNYQSGLHWLWVSLKYFPRLFDYRHIHPLQNAKLTKNKQIFLLTLSPIIINVNWSLYWLFWGANVIFIYGPFWGSNMFFGLRDQRVVKSFYPRIRRKILRLNDGLILFLAQNWKFQFVGPSWASIGYFGFRLWFLGVGTITIGYR